ncbi:hypothetical protein VCSRO160_3620 [Vibrio cholerae]|uniref:hypothetical protein n=1 Tax=Shewanella algae TaxID=38313 RepID=UPI001183A93B|nr:hypothetical protein [Shewanella algae]MDF5542898.1 hypothetical protein [Vibrio parahaemolyticus]TVL08759.1 hypothetical protein AYI82_10535 [Shewanella algae]GHX87248.1 hypothetical protein VCSRO160_3620 [Vibrio cholerae]
MKIKNLITQLNYQLFDIFYGLRCHRIWFVILVISLIALFAFNYLNGYVKPQSQLDWLDIIGEGSSTIMVLVWVLVILSTRTPEKITNYFSFGFICILLSLSQDFIDEFIRLESYTMVGNLVECMFIGLGIVTYAFWQWRKELLVISNYISQRRKLNPRTPIHAQHYRLPDVRHLHQALTRAKQVPMNKEPIFLLAIHLVNERQLIHSLSQNEVSRLTISISELLFITARSHDLVCHCAAHHYLILMENCNESEASQFARQLEGLLNSFVFYLDSGGFIELEWQCILTPSHEPTHTPQSAQKLIQDSMKPFNQVQSI